MLNAVDLMKYYALQLTSFWISLLGLASIAIVLWFFDPITDLPAKVIATLVYAINTFLHLLDGFTKNQQGRKFDPIHFGLMVLTFCLLIIVLADRANLPLVAVNVLSIGVSFPPLWALWQLAKGERLLLFAIVPLIIAASLYLVPPITSAGISLDHLFVPLPIVSFGCVAWALITRWFLISARRWQRCLTWGPGLESVTMFFIVVPLVALTMLAFDALAFGEIWVAVSGVVVGVLFGSLVSTPLRQFLLSLANLSSKCRCEDGHRLLWLKF